ncbi:MAG: DegV family protein [Anaerolineales bacterium]|nr:DegV family protein [Chloroflexota bacterium]MBL6980175.1 DegV family protein [Anaerolineales bacterium]
MLRIALDTAGDIPSDWVNEYDVNMIPINIHFGEQTFYQGVDLDNEGFYKLVDETGVIPKTSQPTPQQFVDFYRQIAEPGDSILSIHVTSKLSGTYASAEIAARDLEGEYNVFPVDSAAGSAAQGFMAKEARQMERAGSPIEAILDRLKSISKYIEVILTLDTLDYARMSGRVGTMQAAMASLLNVKPIVMLSDGFLEMSDKVRTRSKSLEQVINLIKDRIGDGLANVAVVHARDPKAGEALMKKVRNVLNCNSLILTELSIGIAANLGPGTVGIVAYPIEQE